MGVAVSRSSSEATAASAARPGGGAVDDKIKSASDGGRAHGGSPAPWAPACAAFWWSSLLVLISAHMAHQVQKRSAFLAYGKGVKNFKLENLRVEL